jgi:hypothetical protein
LARPMKERIKDWRDNKAKTGGKSLTVMLESESAKILEDLKGRYGESNAKLIARALSCLFRSVTCKREEEVESLTCKQIDAATKRTPEALPGSRMEEFSAPKEWVHPSLKSIKEKLNQGKTVIGLKDELKNAIKIMRKENIDSSGIADYLFKAGIKSIKGNERWEGGMIRKWWK